jgi:type VI secretion system secreted protein Hcp
MKRLIGLVIVAALAVMGLTACMGDDDSSSAQQQRRTAAIGPSGGAGQEYQLTIDGLTGPNEAINVDSFSWGATNPVTFSATGGAGTGKVKFNDFVIKKTTDKASPLLFEGVASGKIYPQATLAVRKAGAKEAYYELRFSTVFVSGLENAGENPNVPMESVSFAYAKAEIISKGQPESGAVEEPVQFGWDQVANKRYVG